MELRDFSTEENADNREMVVLHNTSKLVVQASFWLLDSVTSDIFLLDPPSMRLDPGQKQVADNNNNTK